MSYLYTLKVDGYAEAQRAMRDYARAQKKMKKESKELLASLMKTLAAVKARA